MKAVSSEYWYDMHSCTEMIHRNLFTLHSYCCCIMHGEVPEKEDFFHCQKPHTRLDSVIKSSGAPLPGTFNLKSTVSSEVNNWASLLQQQQLLQDDLWLNTSLSVSPQADIWLTFTRQLWNRILKMEFWVLPVCWISLMLTLMSSTGRVW